MFENGISMFEQGVCMFKYSKSCFIPELTKGQAKASGASQFESQKKISTKKNLKKSYPKEKAQKAIKNMNP